MSGKNWVILALAIFVILAGNYFFTQGKKTRTKNQSIQKSQEAAPSQEKVLLTAREAYNQLVVEAKKKQPDAVAYKLEAGNNLDESKVDFTNDGKSAGWRFWFLSPSQKEIRVFYYRNGQPSYYPEGGGGGSKITYKASDWTADWQIDSDKAFEIAKREGIVKPLLVQMYEKDASFVFTPKEIKKATPAVKVWWEIWGKDEAGTKRSVLIDASSGNVLK